MRRHLGSRITKILLLVLFLNSFLSLSVNADLPLIHAHIDLNSPLTTSQFSTGITHVDNTLSFPTDENTKAVSDVKFFVHDAIFYENTHIMGWGVDDPWPDPSQLEPSNWGTLDGRLKLIKDTKGVPVLTLCEAPWWMKGQLQADGTTKLLKRSDEWSSIAYSSRIQDDKMNAWLHLVQRVAERYMPAPYNVRYFQVWNELKGYYNPTTNGYDYKNNAGNLNGSHAEHGYTYMYNRVYQRLMSVARSLDIPSKDIKVGGPYVVMDTWSSMYQSNPSNIIKSYGIYDQRPLDVIQYWLKHKLGASFIAVEGSNINKDGITITDPFTASEKFADIAIWIRSLNNTNYPGALTLPIWFAEWYASPYSNTQNDDYNNAVKAYAISTLLNAGGAVSLSWGGLGEGESTTGLWTNPQRKLVHALPWYYTYKAFREFFPPGTRIYKSYTSFPSLVGLLASYTHVMLINKTASNINVYINGILVSLYPYQVTVIALPGGVKSETYR